MVDGYNLWPIQADTREVVTKISYSGIGNQFQDFFIQVWVHDGSRKMWRLIVFHVLSLTALIA